MTTHAAEGASAGRSTAALDVSFEAHAVACFETLGGLDVAPLAEDERLEIVKEARAAVVGRTLPAPGSGVTFSGSMQAFLWAFDTVRGRDDVPAADAFKHTAELAVAVVEVVRPFLERRGLIDEVTGHRKSWDRGPDGEMHYTEGPVTRERLHPARFLERGAGGERTARLETVEVDGKPRELLAFDVLLAELLEELGQPSNAAKVRATPIEERGARWIDDGSGPRAGLAIFAVVWARLQEARATPSVRLLQVEHEGAAYVQVPKVLGGIAWAFGTSGEVVDGDRYEAAPNVTRYVSRSIGLVPDGRLRQTLLPVDVAEEPLAVRVLTDTQAVVSGVGGKAALLLAVAARQGGGLCKMTVDELCAWLWPEARIQRRDRARAVDAVRKLRSLAVVLPNGVDFPLWQIAAPDSSSPDGDLELTFGWSTLATADDLGGNVATMLRGRFLLNLSGAMRLKADHALELRTYVHAAAGWNEARRGASFDPAFAPKGTLEELAARVNALSAPALQYLTERGKSGRRQAVSDDRRRMKDALERLTDEAELVRVEKVGRDRLALLPPEALLEAYELTRTRGRRPSR